MYAHPILGALTAVLVGVAAPPGDTARDAAPPAHPLSASDRRAIVAEVAKAMRDEYVDPEVGARAADRLQHALAAGDYDTLSRPEAFADRLTADLSVVARDKPCT